MSVPTTETCANKLEAIRLQMEYYFCDANIMRDTFLLRHVEQDPYVPLELFLSFNKIKELTQDVREISASLAKSEVLKLDRTGLNVRRKNPLPTLCDVKEKTLYVESLPEAATINWLKECFSGFGTVSYVLMPLFTGTQKHKDFAFVVFEENAAVWKALREFTHIGGVLSMEHTDPSNLASIRAYKLQEEMETDGALSQNAMDAKRSTGSKISLPSDTNNKKNKEEVALMSDIVKTNIPPSAMQLKILPKESWCSLRNKYLNKIKSEEDPESSTQNDKKKEKPQSSYEHGLIIKCTLNKPCAIAEVFRSKMREHETVKYMDIKMGDKVAYLRMITANAAKDLVAKLNCPEMQLEVLTGQPEAEYWRQINSYRKVAKEKTPQQKRGR